MLKLQVPGKPVANNYGLLYFGGIVACSFELLAFPVAGLRTG